MRTVFDIKRKQELEKEIASPDLWKDKNRAIKIQKEFQDILENFQKLENVKKEFNELKKIKSEEEFNKKYEDLIKKLKKKSSFSGKYDKKNAILSIYAGAGGQDSQDWATMLLRMYERYCQKKGFKLNILHQSFGEGGGPDGRIGTKQVTIEIKGNYAYGFLKKESGVHRLVRISPFSSKDLRHTSFSLVEVLPDIGKEIEQEIDINPKDLKIDTFRASGPGGQYVNKRDSAIRITHIPTKTVVSCQTERLQGLNRDRAMKILYAKLYKIKTAEKEKEIKDIKGDKISAEWGSQIRSYVLHPYKLVKDLRTKVETSNVEAVLDGNLDKFIEALINYD